MGTDPICVHYSALSSVKWRCSVSATTLYVNYYINYGSQCMLFQVYSNMRQWKAYPLEALACAALWSSLLPCKGQGGRGRKLPMHSSNCLAWAWHHKKACEVCAQSWLPCVSSYIGFPCAWVNTHNSTIDYPTTHTATVNEVSHACLWLLCGLPSNRLYTSALIDRVPSQPSPCLLCISGPRPQIRTIWDCPASWWSR